MREILFRGKRVDTGEWVEGYFVLHVGSAYILCNRPFIGKSVPISGILINYIEVIPETVGQYTGLDDKHGKRIFEGDMLIIYDDCPEDTQNSIVTVVFIEGCFYGDDGKYKELLFEEANGAEIIGNIHDNPELLEVQG